jgi:hypothetical protein
MKKNTQKNHASDTGIPSQNQLAYEQEINRRAYELWEASGRQNGEDMSHWLQAEREVQARRRSENG